MNRARHVREVITKTSEQSSNKTLDSVQANGYNYCGYQPNRNPYFGCSRVVLFTGSSSVRYNHPCPLWDSVWLVAYRNPSGHFRTWFFKHMKSQALEENPFGDNMPTNYMQRQSVPECGHHERAILGYLTLMPVEDAVLISDTLHPMDFQFPLHAAMYKCIVRHARAGRTTLEVIAEEVDRWLTTDIGYVQPRRYLGFCMEIACQNYQEAAICIEWIQECAARRRRYESHRKALELCTNLDRTIDQIDAATDALIRDARKVNQGLSVTPGTPVITIEKSSTSVPFKENPRYELAQTKTISQVGSSVK